MVQHKTWQPNLSELVQRELLKGTPVLDMELMNVEGILNSVVSIDEYGLLKVKAFQKG